MKKIHSVTWTDSIEYYPPPILSPLFQQCAEFDPRDSQKLCEPVEKKSPTIEYTCSDFEIHICIDRISDKSIIDVDSLENKVKEHSERSKSSYDIYDYMGFKWFLKINCKENQEDGHECGNVHQFTKIQVSTNTICLICNNVSVQLYDRMYYCIGYETTDEYVYVCEQFIDKDELNLIEEQRLEKVNDTVDDEEDEEEDEEDDFELCEVHSNQFISKDFMSGSQIFIDYSCTRLIEN